MHTITPTEYERRRRHEYAGPASELNPNNRVAWPASHWTLELVPGTGTCLVPVEVVETQEDAIARCREAYVQASVGMTKALVEYDQASASTGAAVEKAHNEYDAALVAYQSAVGR